MMSQMIFRSEKSPRGAELCMSKMCKREGEGSDGNGDDEDPGLVVNGGVLKEVQ